MHVAASPMRAYASARPPRAQLPRHCSACFSACDITGADAVHPAYGFSRLPRFPILHEHDIHFIGSEPAIFGSWG